MTTCREFLGWDQPLLPTAARWLADRYTHAGRCDLSNVLVVTPGRRAARRLLDLLVEAAQREHHYCLIPPDLITIGQLPEHLYTPRTSVADRLVSLLARAQALKLADAQIVSKITLHPPGRDDFIGWLTLAGELANVADELAAHGLDVSGVPAILAEKIWTGPDHDRWSSLAALERSYQRVLTDSGRQDRNRARIDAVDQHRCASDCDIVLIATADLSPLIQKMLRQVSDRVTALIHAPADHKAGFDDLGCFRANYWGEQAIDLDTAQLRVVDRQRDQTVEVLRVIESCAQDDRTADEITIGLGDQTVGPSIHQALTFADVPARLSVGKPVDKTAPAMLMSAYAAFCEDRRFDHLASLLRHPDIDRYLSRRGHRSADATASGSTRPAAVAWQTLLDRYIQDHLQCRLTQHWLGDPQAASQLKQVYDEIVDLLPAREQERRPLSAWAAAIAGLLETVYGDQDLDTHSDTARALAAIGEALREIAQVTSPPPEIAPGFAGGSPPETLPGNPSKSEATPWALGVTATEAIRVVLSRLQGHAVAPQSSGTAIEMLGWLELQLDDAPVLIIMSMNEGLVPQSRNTDPLLPDPLRAVLGMKGSTHRYARDLLILQAILHSRERVALITPRRGVEDEPLLPSRLLLHGRPQHAARLIQAFYQQPIGDSGSTPYFPWLGTPAQASGFTIPTPEARPPLTQLAITAFGDYLDCPYRFYLKHILKLDRLDDRAVELDSGRFGSLAHEVLRRFGRSDLIDSTNPRRLFDFLADQVDRLSRQWFGPDPPTAVRLQSRQLCARLEAFADWQAQQADAGWRIVAQHVEEKITATLEVDGQPFTIAGRIDRIDRHEDGRWRIADYKTRDTAMSPEKTHQRKCETGTEWVNLQLPLYRVLAATVGVAGDTQLGFIQLPKDQGQVGFAPAPWSGDELESAVGVAQQVIRNIRSGVFWPPTDPRDRHGWSHDGLGWICHDPSLDRQRVVHRSQPEAVA